MTPHSWMYASPASVSLSTCTQQAGQGQTPLLPLPGTSSGEPRKTHTSSTTDLAHRRLHRPLAKTHAIMASLGTLQNYNAALMAAQARIPGLSADNKNEWQQQLPAPHMFY